MLRFYDSMFFGDEGMTHILKKEATTLDEYFDLCLELIDAGDISQKKRDCFKERMWQQAVFLGNVKVDMVIYVGKDKYQVSSVSPTNIKANGETIKFKDITNIAKTSWTTKNYHFEVLPIKMQDFLKMTKQQQNKYLSKPTTYGITDTEIRRILEQVQPTKKIRKDAMDEIKALIDELYAHLDSLDSYDEQLQTVLPGELGKHAYIELNRFTPSERMTKHPAVLHSIDTKNTHIILDYVAAELLELAGNEAKTYITFNDLQKAISRDSELSQMWRTLKMEKLSQTWKKLKN
jgi:hypothetical protein